MPGSDGLDGSGGSGESTTMGSPSSCSEASRYSSPSVSVASFFSFSDCCEVDCACFGGCSGKAFFFPFSSDDRVLTDCSGVTPWRGVRILGVGCLLLCCVASHCGTSPGGSSCTGFPAWYSPSNNESGMNLLTDPVLSGC